MITCDTLIAEYDRYFLNDPDKWTGPKRNQFAEKVLEKYNITPDYILDVGCGNGHTLKHFKGVYPDAELHGLDLSPVACEIARQNVEGSVISKGFVENANFDVLFDLILCMGVAEHFLDIKNGLRAMRKLLYERELLYLEIPNCLQYDPGEEGYRRLSVGSRQMEWHLKRETWETLIIASGFTIIEAVKGLQPAWEFVWVLS